MNGDRLPTCREQIDALMGALDRLDTELSVIDEWGRALARVLVHGGRLLACGNGGSAADAQHLTAELVGRYRDERQPLSAIALHAETSALTAIGNDYGYDEVFARQVQAHGRPGDVLVALSTSGTSANVVAAARTARQRSMTVWALTGAEPNRLSRVAHETISVDASQTATVQEVHGILVHMLCARVDDAVLAGVPRDDEVIDLSSDHLHDSSHTPRDR